VAVWVASGLLRLDRSSRATLLVIVPLGNTSFLGFPAIAALLGAEHLGFAVMYDQPGTFLALATYASIVAARTGHRQADVAPEGIASEGVAPEGVAADASPVRRVLTFPPFLALVVALILAPIGVPAVLHDLASTLGATVTPLAMLAIGMRLDLGAATHAPLALGTGLVLRMGVAPALVLGVAALLGATGPVWDVSLLQSAMPPMVTAAVVAADAGLDDRLAASLAGVGVVVAMVTLPLWALVTG
jgi:malate permease and related proteins